MKLFRAIREYRVREEVKVSANSYSHAIELLEEDDESVVVIDEVTTDYEVKAASLYEIKD